MNTAKQQQQLANLLHNRSSIPGFLSRLRMKRFQLDMLQAKVEVEFTVKSAMYNEQKGRTEIVCAFIHRVDDGTLISFHNWATLERCEAEVSPWEPFVARGLEHLVGLRFRGVVSFYHYRRKVDGQTICTPCPNLHDIANLKAIGFKPLTRLEHQLIAEEDAIGVDPAVVIQDLKRAFAGFDRVGRKPSAGLLCDNVRGLLKGGDELGVMAGRNKVKAKHHQVHYHHPHHQTTAHFAWARA